MILSFPIGKPIENRRNRIIKLKWFLMSCLASQTLCEGFAFPAGQRPLSPPDARPASPPGDLAKGRDVECRNRDGFIPKHTARIFLQIGLGIFSGRGQPSTWLMPQPLLAAVVGQHNVGPAGDTFCMRLVGVCLCIVLLSSKAQLQVPIESCMSVASTKASVGRNKS